MNSCQRNPVFHKTDEFLYLIFRSLSYSAMGFSAGTVSALTVRQGLQGNIKELLYIPPSVLLIYAIFKLLRSFQFGFLYQISSMLDRKTIKIQRALIVLDSILPIPKPALWGILTAVLPCGFLFGALLQAASLAHPVHASISMLLFSIATLPSLVLSNIFINKLKKIKPNHLDRATALILLITALIIFMRMFFDTPMIHHRMHH